MSSGATSQYTFTGLTAALPYRFYVKAGPRFGSRSLKIGMRMRIGTDAYGVCTLQGIPFLHGSLLSKCFEDNLGI